MTLLLLSGRPGSGKTEYSGRLTQIGFVAIETDVSPYWLARLQVESLDQAFKVRDEARSLGPNVVIEWGYLPKLLPCVQRLRTVGFETWWLDGDAQALVESYKRRWSIAEPMQPGQAYRLQKDRIDTVWPNLEKFYGPSRILRTVEEGPRYMTFENFCSAVLADTNE